jgi:hypothetical protein
MFHRHGNDIQDIRRANKRRTPDSADGGVRDEFDAGLLVAVVRIRRMAARGEGFTKQSGG